MKRANLIVKLAAEAAMLGVPFSDRIFRDWVDKRLISKGRRLSGTPNSWLFSDVLHERCLSILALRSAGISRDDLARLYLWVDGYEMPATDVRASLGKEYKRLLAKQRREASSLVDSNFALEMTPLQAKKMEKQLRGLDAELARAGTHFQLDTLNELSSSVYWGQQVPRAKLEDWVMAPFSGAFGMEDEIEGSFIEQLQCLTPANLEHGRRDFWLCVSFFMNASRTSGFTSSAESRIISLYEKVLRTLFTPEWMVFQIALLSIQSLRNGGVGIATELFGANSA